MLNELPVNLSLPHHRYQTREPWLAGETRDQWVGFVGKLSLEKGVHCLIAAAPEIIARIPQARFVLIGDGVARAHLVAMRDALAVGNLDCASDAMRLAAQSSLEPYAEWVAEYWAGLDLEAYRAHAIAANLDQRIVFTGYKTPLQVAQLVRHTDLLVIPSLIKEAFPLVSVEALSSGVMFLAPYTGGLAPILDRVVHEMDGIGALARIEYSAARMVPEMVDGICKVLHYTSSSARRAKLARLCRQFALRHFDWINIVSRIESVYVSALYGHV